MSQKILHPPGIVSTILKPNPVTPTDPDEALNEEPDENRALATHMVAMLLQTQTMSTEAMVSISKWVLTSLLAINGAAAIATWQIDMHPATKVAACGCFVVGVLIALLSGHLQVRTFKELMKPLGQHIGYWITVQSDGERVTALEDMADIQLAVDKASRWPTLLGWAAAVLFAAGALIAGAGGLKEERADRQSKALSPVVAPVSPRTSR